MYTQIYMFWRGLYLWLAVRGHDSLHDILDHPTTTPCSSLNQQTVRFQCKASALPSHLSACSLPLEPPPSFSSHVPAWPYNQAQCHSLSTVIFGVSSSFENRDWNMFGILIGSCCIRDVNKQVSLCEVTNEVDLLSFHFCLCFFYSPHEIRTYLIQRHHHHHHETVNSFIQACLLGTEVKQAWDNRSCGGG